MCYKLWFGSESPMGGGGLVIYQTIFIDLFLLLSKIGNFSPLFRISFRILKIKRNSGGGVGGLIYPFLHNAHFHSGSLCQRIVLEAKPLIGDLKRAPEGYHWLTTLTPLQVGHIWKTAFFCCSCTFKMMLRCKEKETGQVKSSCPKKPFE